MEARSAIITGATGALGVSLAQRLCQEGYHLVLTSTNEGKLESLKSQLVSLRKSEKQVISYHALNLKTAQDSDYESFREFAIQQVGTPTVLINNAGILGAAAPSWELQVEDFNEAWNCNFMSVVQLCRMFIPYMIKAQYGKIINLSGGGATSARKHFSPYAVSKVSVVRFSENLAAELAELGESIHIDVNSIAPGIMKSQMTQKVLDMDPSLVASETSKVQQTFDSSEDSTRFATDLCEFLASEKSDGITGRLISAPWDNWNTLPERKAQVQQSDIYTLRRIIDKDRGFQWDK